MYQTIQLIRVNRRRRKKYLKYFHGSSINFHNGVKVAKHGNKSVSSKCGSADVLEKLNININLSPKEVETINNNKFGFMFAPGYHLAMK